jgi:hypothetical protein
LIHVDVCQWLLATFDFSSGGSGSLGVVDPDELKDTVQDPGPYPGSPPPDPISPEGEAPRQNPDNPFDVDANGDVSPVDVLYLVSHLNEASAGEGEAARADGGNEAQRLYYDVSGDSIVSPFDALLVISHLAAEANAAGEGEGEAATVPNGQGGVIGDQFAESAFVVQVGLSETASGPVADSTVIAQDTGAAPALPEPDADARTLVFTAIATDDNEGETADSADELPVADDDEPSLLDLEVDEFDLLVADVAREWF